MSRRRISSVVAAAMVGMAATMGVSTPAKATDTSFRQEYRHSSGAIAVIVKGNIRWLNRSVTLTNIEIFAKGGECGQGKFIGYAGSVIVDDDYTGAHCPAVDQWGRVGDVTLDGSQVSGGIRWVKAQALDTYHNGYSSGNYYR